MEICKVSVFFSSFSLSKERNAGRIQDLLSQASSRAEGFLGRG